MIFNKVKFIKCSEHLVALVRHTGKTYSRQDKYIFRNKMIRSKNQNTFGGLKKWARRFKKRPGCVSSGYRTCCRCTQRRSFSVKLICSAVEIKLACKIYFDNNVLELPSHSKVACKRAQQLPTLLRQQCELWRACWQWCANGATTPNKFGTCSASWEEYNP